MSIRKKLKQEIVNDGYATCSWKICKLTENHYNYYAYLMQHILTISVALCSSHDGLCCSFLSHWQLHSTKNCNLCILILKLNNSIN